MRTVNEIGQDLPLETRTESGSLEFDFLDILLILAARKLLIVLTTLVFAAIAAVLVFFVIRPMYTGKAQIMPPQQEQSGLSALMSQVGALSSLAGGGEGGGLGLKNTSDLYVGLLKSETVANDLVKQFDLVHLYREKRLSQAQRELARRSTFLVGKDSLISISVEDHDPNRAAAMANAYVSELDGLNSHLAITQAAQRRLFYEQQLAQEKDKLADAEVALKQTEESTGAIAPTGQTENVIRQIAQVEAGITSREVELDALRTSSTDENPNVVRLNTELDSLRSQLQEIESGQQKHRPGDISITTADVPTVGLEYIRKERDVKYHQLLFDLLARQYEAARIDEAKAAPLIQVVDPAKTPDWKSGPHRLLWVAISALLGLFAGSAWSFLEHVYSCLQTDEIQAGRVELLKQRLRLK